MAVISSAYINIPSLINQPYVENSILRGFTGIINYVKRINILADRSGNQFRVIIQGKKSGMTSDIEREPELDTKIANERIALLTDQVQVLIESYYDEMSHLQQLRIQSR